MSEHSPLPWELDAGSEIANSIFDFNGKRVLSSGKWLLKEADAAYIIEACNNYPALQARVEELQEALENLCEYFNERPHIIGCSEIAQEIKELLKEDNK